jgi:hypothetical protein
MRSIQPSRVRISNRVSPARGSDPWFPGSTPAEVHTGDRVHLEDEAEESAGEVSPPIKTAHATMTARAAF